MKRYYTAVIEKDPESGLYVGYIPEVQGAHTQAKTLDELNKNLIEVLGLCLEEDKTKSNLVFPEFIGTQQIAIEA